ncbi:MAG TPA: hypothetical protein VKV21_09805 [Solirubrobacteraceae bacterium]|nr:hypothetical protein [Solirubrobacteraceae bacterium]
MNRDAVWICATCGVEHAEPSGVCAICADERQWVPADGQRWTTLAELDAAGHRVRVQEREPGLLELSAQPKVGIGHHGFLVSTPEGSLLWDPPGYLDETGLARVRDAGPVLAIAASHPHMFGAQAQWSRALGDPPILVCEPQLEWVTRPDDAIESWRGRREIAPGLTLVELGGHFAGSSVAHWSAGAGGRGVLLSSDTIHANPDRATTTFLRSYPNRIPLSPAVVERITRGAEALDFERLYDNFGRGIEGDARAAVRRSAERYIAWVRGDYDHLTS